MSEKVVRWLMEEEGLQVKSKRTRKYRSYKGEITPTPANIIALPFHATKPNPNAALVNEMLVQVVSKLKDNEHPIVHTDRGCHYRWLGWIELMEKNSLILSMSAKDCSPDN